MVRSADPLAACYRLLPANRVLVRCNPLLSSY